MKRIPWTLMMALLAVIGLSTPLAAQCSGGTCPNGGSSTGGCPTGSCPNSGKSLKRVPKPANSGGTARQPVAVDPKGVPSWQKPSTDAIETAAKDERPIVVYFPSEGAADTEFYGEELSELSKLDAMFMKMNYYADREESPWAEKSAVPTSKLLSDNPARDYDVPVGKAVVLVCDWYGNEYYRETVDVNAKKLSALISKVKDEVEDSSDKLQKNLDKARTYLDKEDRKNALKYLLKNFKEDLVGLGPQEDSIRMYHEILDTARTELATLIEKKDADGIKALAKEFKKTDIKNEIDDAMDGMKS